MPRYKGRLRPRRRLSRWTRRKGAGLPSLLDKGGVRIWSLEKEKCKRNLLCRHRQEQRLSSRHTNWPGAVAANISNRVTSSYEDAAGSKKRKCARDLISNINLR
eukprot:scaffold958_cov97-Alexandrium_tamarense.AAC.2